MTIRQMQNLMQYLGYYEGIPDGVWGSLSTAGAKKFQRDWGGGLEITGQPDGATGEALVLAVSGGMPQKNPDQSEDLWKQVRYWKKAEFRCRCGDYHEAYCSGYPVEPDRTLVLLLDDLRHHFGAPAIASSGIRCTRHNRDVGGVSDSRHLTGKAMDFYIQGVSGKDLQARATQDSRCRYSYVIDDDYVHVDVY